MNETRRTVPAPWPGLSPRTGEHARPSGTPIYDAVVRQWREQGREIPRPPSPPRRWARVESADLFLRD
ncbi:MULTISPECIES: hypothetical protein [unclassified Streptomyces]|uniref:hypothetical protein n=1 Tax=unclassified Streptomyces TaxID=2593676 RepID=UPI00226DA436|nr:MULTISPECIES: hypothetical protein [unclassified Streptomyces]MCY0921529.1 hypothetical protein [Streptomyces sp. H27-G5]MCY0960458.1 hypothetical protein [Streptomyces sp. H27-H5]